jgi:integrase
LKALELRGEDREQYVAALQTLAEFNQTLDSAIREYVEAKRIIKGSTLIEAARFFHRFGQSIQLTATVPDLVKKLIADLRSDKKSEYHVSSLESRLERFAEAFPGQILNVKTEDINQWLRKLKGKNAKGDVIDYAGKTRNHFRNSVVQLFNYARTHGFLPKGMPTEAEPTVTVEEAHSENEVFTVEEMTKLMNNAPQHLVPAMAIKAFSGVRTEEICNMQWEHVDFEKGYIILPASVTKTNNRRLIPLANNLRAWLEPFKGKKGRVCVRWARPQAVFQAFDRYGKRQGVNVGANKYRNSYISYRVALTKNVAEVALESGNSPRIIQNEYLQLTTSNEGVRWFNILPVVKPPQTSHPSC